MPPLIEVEIDGTFESWQTRARALLASGAPPSAVLWAERGTRSPLLPLSEAVAAPDAPARARVPRRFLELARVAARHRTPERWALLYRVLWRVVHESRALLDDPLDADAVELHRLVRQVRHDLQRLLAFLRFRPVDVGDGERLIAWYTPDHDVAPLAAEHFAARYPNERWTIFTPGSIVHGDAGAVRVDGGMAAEALPVQEADDAAARLWRLYYEAAFNPARANENKLLREMPARFWSGLPEAASIPRLLAEAPVTAAALRRQHGGATTRAALSGAADLDALRRVALVCRLCPLHENATQTVFGEGPADAALMLVGEQPGDSEDRRGRPFVGPAGEVLDAALQSAGIDRTRIYLTNAVKHFGFEPRGKWRIHRTPRLSEIQACRPFLEQELALVRPTVVVALGGVAARALLGPQARVTKLRGAVLSAAWAPAVIVTLHPSAVLRTGPEGRDAALAGLHADLQLAAATLSALQSKSASGIDSSLP